MNQRKLLIMFSLLLLLSLSCNIWLLIENRRLVASWQPMDGTSLQVHVIGAVAKPGVYALARDSRVADALQAAGGTLPQALLHNLNLAKPLFDGEQILVLEKPEATDSAEEGVVAAELAAGQPTLININTATAAELEQLPGIGPVKAQAIVAWRQQNGAFARIEDLTKVSGIGEKTFAKLKALITVR